VLVRSSICLIRHLRFRFGLGNQPRKIFAIGFNKTATSSLHDLFEALGYHSHHGEYWRETDSASFHLLFDAFSDGIPADFSVLDKSFSNSKFILQVRDLDAWMSSRIEHILQRPKNRKNKISEDWTVEISSLESWVINRNKYHLEVLRHFKDRPDDLLVINYINDPDSISKICNFLGHTVIESKPHANRNNRKKRNELLHAEKIAECLLGLGIPEEEWSSDLLCPSLLKPDSLKEMFPASSIDLVMAK
jgi:hypothetical protein